MYEVYYLINYDVNNIKIKYIKYSKTYLFRVLSQKIHDRHLPVLLFPFSASVDFCSDGRPMSPLTVEKLMMIVLIRWHLLIFSQQIEMDVSGA